jgi:gamma-glutamyl-gamma-aminobutyraldehyde dehydrogenase/4-guanidinobutyraldehyde dehydrogenase/NAD-dependent aldehyde dehydrogenase
MTVRNQLYIDGAFADATDGATIDAVSPRDGAVLAKVAAAGPADVDRAVAAARRVFEAGSWSAVAPRQRKKALLTFADLIRENAEELAQLETLDVGKPIGDSRKVDVPTCAAVIQWYAEAIDKIYDEIAPTGPGTLAQITRAPLGVVAAVVPWNYPLILTAWKIGPALAMGNSVIVKPAEQSSLSALLLAELATKAGLPDGVLNVLPGEGPVTGKALGLHPDVDKVAFTGSGEVGRMFLGYSAQSNGKQVSTELGGKSAQVVLDSAGDLDAAASSVAWGIFYNTGQTCNAGSRLIVTPGVRDELIAKVAAIARSFRVGDPLDDATQMGPLVDLGQAGRVGGYLDLARSEGAVFLAGGEPPAAGSCFMEPTILSGLPNSSRVAQEEIFGPVLTVITAKDEADAIAQANDTRYGLAASVWTSDLATAHRAASQLRAGVVWVNTFDAGDVMTPFGGFKDSGYGRDRSLHALDAFSALKTTWINLT